MTGEKKVDGDAQEKKEGVPNGDPKEKDLDSTEGEPQDLSKVLEENIRGLVRHIQGVASTSLGIFALVRHVARRDEAERPEAPTPRRRKRRHDVEH